MVTEKHTVSMNDIRHRMLVEADFLKSMIEDYETGHADMEEVKSAFNRLAEKIKLICCASSCDKYFRDMSEHAADLEYFDCE